MSDFEELVKILHSDRVIPVSEDGLRPSSELRHEQVSIEMSQIYVDLEQCDWSKLFLNDLGVSECPSPGMRLM